MGDLVSIITPSYNCGRFIGETIRCVLAQTYANWEMIIVDDCSTDNTDDVVTSCGDPRIHYIKNSTREGAALARNKALRNAKGRWIAFLDADDLWLPEKLERQISFMTENGYSFTYHEYTEIDEHSKPQGVIMSGKRHVSKLAMRCCCWPGCLTVMYDAQRVGVIQIADMKKNNDFAMWLRIIEKCDCHLLPQQLAQYRRRSDSITPSSAWEKIWWHYLMFRNAEEMSALSSAFWTVINIFCNTTKKLFYRKRIIPIGH